jgi:hypothetical protein
MESYVNDKASREGMGQGMQSSYVSVISRVSKVGRVKGVKGSSGGEYKESSTYSAYWTRKTSEGRVMVSGYSGIEPRA